MRKLSISKAQPVEVDAEEARQYEEAYQEFSKLCDAYRAVIDLEKDHSRLILLCGMLYDIYEENK